MEISTLIWFIILISFTVTYSLLKWGIPKLIKNGMVGKDINKPDKPEVAEMGGFAVLIGSALGLALLLTVNYFTTGTIYNDYGLKILGIMLVLIFVGLVGMLDDLLDLPKWMKFILPIIGALPILFLEISKSTEINIPFIGKFDLGIFYSLLLIPFAITVAANLTNILAGFNGLEYGLAIVNYFFLLLCGMIYQEKILIDVSIIMLSTSIAFLIFNKYPSKVFPGDTGTLIIGGTIMAMLISTQFKFLSVFIFAIYGIDLIFKILNGLPSTNWWGTYRDGKLYVDKNPISFAQFIMKISNGISEQNLVKTIILLQVIILTIALIIVLINYGMVQ